MGIGIVILGLEELDKRARDLARLSTRMLQQHEDERRRISLELHDQTAQVWAAVRMQLGLIREAAPLTLAPRLDRALDLVDRGIQSIRGVTTTLRPPIIDDLGLIPALRALVDSFTQAGLSITFQSPDRVPAISTNASVALFRALQEALSNVARHSGATAVDIRLTVAGNELTLLVRDNGRGFPAPVPDETATLGLGGMRERIAALNGSVTLASEAGASVTVRVPIDD